MSYASRPVAMNTTRTMPAFGIAVLLALVAPLTASDADSADAIQRIISQSGVDRGVCSILGFNKETATQLVRSDKFLIHVLDRELETIAELHKVANKAGLGIDRVVIEQSSYEQLPYADNMIDLLLATQVSEADLTELSVQEVLRVLRPEGVAVIGRTSGGEVSDQFAGKLEGWSDVDGVETLKSPLETLVVIRKPVPEGIDQWSHWEHEPDNNPVSTDQVIQAPYMTQFTRIFAKA